MSKKSTPPEQTKKPTPDAQRNQGGLYVRMKDGTRQLVERTAELVPFDEEMTPSSTPESET